MTGSEHQKDVGVLKKITSTLRVSQWYKNLLVFLGLIFERVIFDDFILFAKCFVGFMVLCGISSSNYIINDLLDRRDDEKNRIKQSKGYLGTTASVVLTIALAASCLLISCFISPVFFFLVIMIAILGQLYNFKVKDVIVGDVIVLSIIYVLRAFSGYFLINVIPNLLNIMPIAFIALFLTFIKKRSTIKILGYENAIKFRNSYKFYNIVRCNRGINIFAILTCFYYFLYILFNVKFNFFLIISSFPLFIYLIYEVIVLTNDNPDIGIFLWKTLKYPKIVFTSLAIILLYVLMILVD
ncbi:MAG: UbiA family prenyltransferase [Promethearchaeota archaeon]